MSNKMCKVLVLLFVVAFVENALADLYLHMPRGANDRLNEANAERDNDARLYDTQNNNRGGYNIGDLTATAATSEATQYQMVFLEGSILPVEWTNQHGCGGNEQTDPRGGNCNMVMQYMCDRDDTDPAMAVTMRDGTTTNTVQENDDTSPDITTGIHESAQYYRECKTRAQNYGLYWADQDQNKQGTTAIYTRQNPAGTRSGLECQEERDYYPYWGPTPFVDVFYSSDHVNDPTQPGSSYQVPNCGYILQNSQNLISKAKCYDPANPFNAAILSAVNESQCNQLISSSGSWKSYGPWSLNAVPDCFLANWTRENHLGNGRDTQPQSYNWTLPMVSDLQSMGMRITNGMAKCIVRMRYNISTDDYDPWNTFSNYNSLNSPTVQLITNNPTVDVHADLQGLTLALNTNQYGRTFQDRSHTFYIAPRPTNLVGKTVHNLSVRGKRGNIVQVYPAVEYDFVPNNLVVSTSDFIHVQWTGSNTHNNNPNSEDAGDGQGGDAGQGTDGTDRSNFVLMGSLSTTYPLALDKNVSNMFVYTQCTTINGLQIGSDWRDCAVLLATSGFYQNRTAVPVDSGSGNAFDPLLDNAPPSLYQGVVLNVGQPGTYNYMCTRNNNFSNRTQKGTLIVTS